MGTPTTISEYQDKTLELVELAKDTTKSATIVEALRSLQEIAGDAVDLAKGIVLAAAYVKTLKEITDARASGFQSVVVSLEKENRRRLQDAPAWLKL